MTDAQVLAPQINAPNEIFQLCYAQLSQSNPDFLGDEAEEVDDHFRQSDEVLASEHVVLCCNTSCAIVQMTDAQVLAPQCHQRTRAKAETFGAKGRRLDDVEPGLQPTIRLQTNLVPQVVRAQHLVRLREPEFPRTACVFD